MKNDLARLDDSKKQIVSPNDVEGLVEAWLKDLRRIRAPDTVSAYQDAVKDYFLKWLDRNGLDLFEVGPLEVETWLDRMAQTVTKGTISIRFYGVRSFYRYLYKTRRLRWDPTYATTIPRSKVHPKTGNRKAPTDKQVRQLLATCDNESFKGIRDKAILSLMIYCGLRSIEIHRANADDFDTKTDGEDERMILYVWGKGRESRNSDDWVKIPLHREERINRWMAIRRPEGEALFTYPGETRRLKRGRIYDLIKDRFKMIGLEEKVPHSLRHFFVTNSLENGAPLRQVQMAARHSSMDVTLGYAERIDRMKHAAEDFVDFGEFCTDDVDKSRNQSEVRHR